MNNILVRDLSLDQISTILSIKGDFLFRPSSRFPDKLVVSVKNGEGHFHYIFNFIKNGKIKTFGPDGEYYGIIDSLENLITLIKGNFILYQTGNVIQKVNVHDFLESRRTSTLFIGGRYSEPLLQNEYITNCGMRCPDDSGCICPICFNQSG